MENQKHISKKENNWQITANRFVVYIDIMGFKDMVTKTPHQKIYQMMKKIEKEKQNLLNINWRNRGTDLVDSTTYSDSIMLYSKTGSYSSLRSLLATTAALLNTLFIENIPFTGAMAFGKMTLDPDNSIYFGQPLIDAYLLQEEIHFYGVVLHSSAEDRIDNYWKTKNFPHVFPHLCPFKNGKSNHMTIAPIYSTLRKVPRFKDQAEKLYVAIENLKYNTSGSLRQYVDNTVEYINILKGKEKS